MPACRSFAKAGQTQLALNLYDFHARHYDPALGRWHNIDPKSQFASPYLAMGNNPIMMVDPDGQEALALVIIGAVVGAYIGGAAANGGELNPIQWNYSDFNTYLGIVVGGAVGAFTGNVAYWGVVKGTMKLSLAYAVPGLGSIGLVGNSTNWFQGIQWTSNGGGQGNIDFDNDVEWGNIISGTNEDFSVYTGGYRQTQYNDELQDWIYTKLYTNNHAHLPGQIVEERYNRNFLGTYDKWAGEYGMYVSMLNGIWDSFGLGFSSVLHQSRTIGWGPGEWAYATGKTRAILNSPAVKIVGTVFGVAGTADALIDAYQAYQRDDLSWKHGVRVVGNAGTMFLKANPIGFGVSFGYGLLDLYLSD